MHRIVSCLITFFAIISMLGIISCKDAKSQKSPNKTVLVLIDYSESVREARKDYIDAIKKVIPKVKLGDHLFVWKITRLSEMETKPLIDEDFPYPPPQKNDFYWKQAVTKAEREAKIRFDEIGKKIEGLLNSNSDFSRKTDILGSLQVAEKVFKKDKKDKAVLIIMSDMIEDSSEYNFERERLSDKRIGEIINHEKIKKRLPDLSGVNVYVVGAKAPTREQYQNIQNFWLRYFKECGANLPKENYGSALLIFNE
ncbi:hypothetical protein JZK55_14840 [Dissulfurispira thermophila]|uniref:VWFA domain-containing protein n=1 Tax=Dissulfurispira thermophila TaxID=2715679 RepID=A0A7G1H343_9BACT|nr:hypothetical protein [Dissulfurispira thermophila]BCB96562.1 hypothetical protein JZK55_14840 [Dissulfurispira thermophila]